MYAHAAFVLIKLPVRNGYPRKKKPGNLAGFFFAQMQEKAITNFRGSLFSYPQVAGIYFSWNNLIAY